MSRGFVITQTGKKLLAELVATRQELNITRVMVGKGELPQGHSPEQFADLIEPVTQATSTIPVVKNGVISFIVEYRNDLNGGLQEGFWLKEFGVFAQDGENEILLYYASLGEYPQYVEAYENGKVNIKKYPVAITVADGLKDDVNVTLEYAPVAFVTEQRMKEFVEIEALPYLEGVLAESENGILAELDKKADKETVQQALDTKANAQDVEIALNQKADIEVITEELAKKANTETVQQILNQKADAKAIEQALDKKADIEVVQEALDQKANEMEILQKLSEKADKEAMITELAVKADKEEVQTELDKKVDIEEIEEILQQQIDSTNIVLELDKKADKETVAEELAKKANAETMQEELNKKADAEIVSDALALKADSETMQTELDKKADIATMTEELAKKSNTSHTHNYAGSSSAGGVANSATKLNTARIIDGMPFDGSANIVHFGVCETAADVAAKVVSLPGFVLAEGARIIVYFLNGHAKSSPSLNVNNTGAKPMSCVVGAYAPLNQWEAKQAVEFIYYSNHWIMLTANARRLYTARTIRTNLTSTSSASFDGTANITPGVTGTLPIANGGTGATTAAQALGNLGGFSNTGGRIEGSVAQGSKTTSVSGDFAHAEGNKTKANGNYSHAEGYGSIAESGSSHAEGNFTKTLGIADHTEGSYTVSVGAAAHAEGNGSLISEDIIEIKSTTTNTITFNTTDNISSATFNKLSSGTKIGIVNYSYYDNNVVYATIASVDTTNKKVTLNQNLPTSNFTPYFAFAIPTVNVTSCKAAHAEGYFTIAAKTAAHAEGYFTIAGGNYQTVMGQFNKISITSNDKLIIGNGSTPNARSNCLRVTNTSGVYSNSTFKSSGADYAEMFEWLDGNKDKKERTGLFVTLEGEKIRIATPEDDYILGIVSACPSVCGDVYDDTWANMHLTDIYGQPILEEVEIPERTEEFMTINEEGEEVKEVIVIEQAHTEIRQKLNTEYDNTKEYIPRSERPEWDAVGILGKLVAIDDGSCEENGWCKVGEGGIATISEQKTRFRVMKRLDQNHIKIFIL